MLVKTKDAFFRSILQSDEVNVNRAIDEKVNAYYTFEIPKKSGLRTINAIRRNDPLYNLQINLYRNFILSFPIPINVKGFIKGESYKTYLEPHQGGNFFLRIDLKDFFRSINKNHIRKMLLTNISMPDEEERDYIIKIITEICTLDGILPQGAITSPGISNLVFARMDQRILKYCQILNIEYTRYADDLLFSSVDFNFEQNGWFLKKIRQRLNEQNFKLNYTKKQTTTGSISLNGFVIADQIRLARKRFFDIDIVLSCGVKSLGVLRTKGEDEYIKIINSLRLRYRDLNRYPFISVGGYIQYLSGYRSYYINWINPYFDNTPSQKRLIKTITKIEGLINKIEKALK